MGITQGSSEIPGRPGRQNDNSKKKKKKTHTEVSRLLVKGSPVRVFSVLYYSS